MTSKIPFTCYPFTICSIVLYQNPKKNLTKPYRMARNSKMNLRKEFLFPFSICGFRNYFTPTRVNNSHCLTVNYHLKHCIGTEVTSDILTQFLSISSYCHLSCSRVYLSFPFHHSNDKKTPSIGRL